MLVHVEQGYASNGNHYHNHLHACDVLQTIHYFISETVAVVSKSPKMWRVQFSRFRSRILERAKAPIGKKGRQRESGDVERWKYSFSPVACELKCITFASIFHVVLSGNQKGFLAKFVVEFQWHDGIEKTFQSPEIATRIACRAKKCFPFPSSNRLGTWDEETKWNICGVHFNFFENDIREEWTGRKKGARISSINLPFMASTRLAAFPLRPWNVCKIPFLRPFPPQPAMRMGLGSRYCNRKSSAS